ncbi:hypothetical protein ABE485_29070 [Achromobacter spanius]|uniref:hypothetical protein n=1 Tax=Achromobacter spanius TaxID=217203 RepID=UPI0032093E2C
MKMQQSVFWVDKSGMKFHLSSPVSEWLFSSKFWSDVNSKQGTMFDQYEEDEADVPMVSAVIDALDQRVRGLRELNVRDLEFIYRWTEERIPVRSWISKDVLLCELGSLRDFLANAATENCGVVFSL